ncbi:hypothetical protein LTR62_008512 [Meristemomyces frigidus]|uniref:Uncharacterized protein n=1 Tax=Meristemomyces frigidus TaxID=1508187 RepID=A0AAN7TPK4_9PEZI|nr:hypothetical protein LTR62_008512 [Meristemomyces frigidus]
MDQTPQRQKQLATIDQKPFEIPAWARAAFKSAAAYQASHSTHNTQSTECSLDTSHLVGSSIEEEFNAQRIRIQNLVETNKELFEAVRTLLEQGGYDRKDLSAAERLGLLLRGGGTKRSTGHPPGTLDPPLIGAVGAGVSAVREEEV